MPDDIPSWQSRKRARQAGEAIIPGFISHFVSVFAPKSRFFDQFRRFSR
jgi:hypothetical protein